MSKFTPDTIERVRSAADMVELVSARTELKRQGARYQGLCPFHDERTPSFSIHPGEKLYHCFGCGVGGDLFDFVQATENIDFPEAVELLADRYGIEVVREKEDPEAEERRRVRDRLLELLGRAAAFYAAALTDSAEAGKQREYLASRGLGPEVLEAFGAGYAPSAWDTLLLRGQQAGFSIAELDAVGLVQKGRDGGVYDRFRSRIMFPSSDPRGRTVGFGARATTDDQKPKYLNSAETDFFHKSEILYGIDLARGPMAKSGRAIVVEGYTDVLALHQAGLEETVGIMGTAITEQQLAGLSAVVDTVLLALDADAAGQKAMLRAQQVAAGRRLDLQVIPMPSGEDPAEIAAGPEGRERFTELLGRAVGLPEFHLGLILGRVDRDSPRSRDAALDEAAPVVAGVAPGATREDLIRRLADGLDLEPSTVLARLESAPAPQRSTGSERESRPASSPPVEASGRQVLSRRERRERSMMVMCLARPEEGRPWLEKIEPRHLSSDLMVDTVAWLVGNLDSPTEGLDTQDEAVQKLVSAMVVRADPDMVGEGSIRRNFMELELAALEDEIENMAEDRPEQRAELNRRRSELVEQVRRAEDGVTP